MTARECRAHGFWDCALCREYALGLVDEMDRAKDDDPPLLAGGQGRDVEEIRADGGVVGSMVLIAFGFIAGALAAWAVFS